MRLTCGVLGLQLADSGAFGRYSADGRRQTRMSVPCQIG